MALSFPRVEIIIMYYHAQFSYHILCVVFKTKDILSLFNVSLCAFFFKFYLLFWPVGDLTIDPSLVMCGSVLCVSLSLII